MGYIETNPGTFILIRSKVACQKTNYVKEKQIRAKNYIKKTKKRHATFERIMTNVPGFVSQ